MTPPQDFRERLPELLDERAPRRAPEELFDHFAESMEGARQRPGWATSERWFPMPTQARVGQMQRTAVMVGALLLLVLAMAAAFALGSRLVTSEATIIVAADGSGDVTTLGEGVAIAGDGDTILVRPGVYTEVVTIAQDLIIQGDGNIETIIIRAPDDGPSTDTGALANRSADHQRYAILIVESDGTVSGLTFRGEPSAVVAVGGAPTIEGNHFEGVGLRQVDEVEAGKNSIAVSGGSRAIIRDNRVDGGPIASFDLSEPLIEGNALSGGAHIVGGFGDAAVIRDNRIIGGSEAVPGGLDFFPLQGIESWGDAAPLIERNTIIDARRYGIRLEQGATLVRGNSIQWPGGENGFTGIHSNLGSGSIEDNTVAGYARGVVVAGFDGTISGNSIDASTDGVSLTDSSGTISDNRILAEVTGLTIWRSSPDVVDNTIEGAATGVSIAGEGSAPKFSGNHLCGTARTASAIGGAPEPDLSGLGDCTEV